jgi:hypothetical protein
MFLNDELIRLLYSLFSKIILKLIKREEISVSFFLIMFIVIHFSCNRYEIRNKKKLKKLHDQDVFLEQEENLLPSYSKS